MRIWIGLALLGAATAALALAALHLAAPSGASPLRSSGVCGGDRWYVRTLQDRPKLLPAHKTTLRKLGEILRPKSIPSTRMAIERQIVTLDTHAAVVRGERNGDLRAELYDPQSRVRGISAIAPHPFCNSRATDYRRRQMGTARRLMTSAFNTCGPVRVTGVLFFSTRPNFESDKRVELRPVLGWRRLCDDARRAKP